MSLEKASEGHVGFRTKTKEPSELTFHPVGRVPAVVLLDQIKLL